MLSLKITDVKTFAAHLFAKETFDRFYLHHAVFTTAYHTEIDGKRNASFDTESEERNATESDCVSWKTVRPLCYELLRGEKLPLFFRITLITGKKAGTHYAAAAGLQDAKITSLALNVQYQNELLLLTAGVSYDGFTLDKSAEKQWETDVKAFLLKNRIPFEEYTGE